MDDSSVFMDLTELTLRIDFVSSEWRGEEGRGGGEQKCFAIFKMKTNYFNNQLFIDKEGYLIWVFLETINIGKVGGAKEKTKLRNVETFVRIFWM